MKPMLLSLLTLTLIAGAAAAPFAPPRKAAKKPAASAVVKAAPTKKPALRKPVHPGPVWAVAFSPDGKRVAVGGYRRVTLYDAETGAKTADWLVSGDAIRALVFSADGTRLAAGTGVPGLSGSALFLDTMTGKPVRTVAGHSDTVEAVALSGNLLLSAASDEKVRITDMASGASLGVLREHVGRCLSVAVPIKTSEENGGEIFATGGGDNAVKIWDARTRRVVVNFDQSQGPVWCLAPTVRAGDFLAGSADGKVRLLGVRADRDGKRGDGQRTGFVARTVDAHAGAVYSVAAAPDDKRFVSGGADKKVVIWAANGNKQRELTEAKGDIWGVAVSPDSRRAAAASLDGKTRIYNIETGALLLELPGGTPAAVPPAVAPSTVPETKPATKPVKAVSPRVTRKN